ncbi:hypothetical protein PRZ48_013585 [Zasmidium cellare]|uniref:Uncharacterized protein n=1 Tax=Zasmidium cellare TaxID=395010 RepID=A0ABR0E1F2_ZASCE|nr:hypothetical protein PRZ48_013585 [Zasmidium cellare]
MSQIRQDSLFPPHSEADCHDQEEQKVTTPTSILSLPTPPDSDDVAQTATDNTSERSDELSSQQEADPPLHQDELWQALVNVHAEHQDVCGATQCTRKTTQAKSGRSIKFYPTVLLPTTRTLIVNMLATPTKTESEWPDLTQISQIRFLHPAFSLTLYIAGDESTFSFALGSFTTRFSARQRACFERGAMKMVEEAAVQGMDNVLGTVALLPAFAHMVYEWFDVRGGEIGVDWTPSEEELERHWMVCSRHGWTCRKVE